MNKKKDKTGLIIVMVAVLITLALSGSVAYFVNESKNAPREDLRDFTWIKDKQWIEDGNHHVIPVDNAKNNTYALNGIEFKNKTDVSKLMELRGDNERFNYNMMYYQKIENDQMDDTFLVFYLDNMSEEELLSRIFFKNIVSIDTERNEVDGVETVEYSIVFEDEYTAVVGYEDNVLKYVITLDENGKDVFYSPELEATNYISSEDEKGLK